MRDKISSVNLLDLITPSQTSEHEMKQKSPGAEFLNFPCYLINFMFNVSL